MAEFNSQYAKEKNAQGRLLKLKFSVRQSLFCVCVCFIVVPVCVEFIRDIVFANFFVL